MKATKKFWVEIATIKVAKYAGSMGRKEGGDECPTEGEEGSTAGGEEEGQRRRRLWPGGPGRGQASPRRGSQEGRNPRLDEYVSESAIKR